MTMNNRYLWESGDLQTVAEEIVKDPKRAKKPKEVLVASSEGIVVVKVNEDAIQPDQ